MLRIIRTLRRTLCHYAALYLPLALFFAGCCGFAQSLHFVPPIYNVPLSSLSLLNGPTGLATDVHGSLYIVDTGHSAIWKVDPTETTTLFAGNNGSGYTGDGGLAVNASLSLPRAVAVDVDGNVFIADTFNFAVRRIDAITGIITTIAGGNGSGSSGDGGPAAAAKFQSLTGIAVDMADNIYVADSTSAVVRRISAAGIIATVAGGGSPATGNGDGGPATSAKLTSPYGLALDSSGNLFIADSGASVVREVSTANVISTFAGSTSGNSGMGGPATSAKLRTPQSVATDGGGNVYIIHTANGLLSFVDSSNTIHPLSGLAVFGGVGDGLPASVVQLASPYGVAVDSTGNVFLDSQTSNAVYKVVQHPERFPFTKVGQSSLQQRLIVENTGSASITISSVVAAGDFSITAAIINPNYRPCTGSYGNLSVTPGNNFCTVDVIFTPTAAGIRTFSLTVASNDTPATTVEALTSTGMSPTVAVSGGQIFTVAGMIPEDLTHRTDNLPATQVSLGELDGLAIDSGGNLFIAEYSFCDVRRVDAKTGIITTIAGSVLGVCSSPSGDGGPATQAVFDGVGSLVIGPDKTLYISDGLNHEIRSVDTQGIIHRYAGTGSNICNVEGGGSQAASVAICAATGLAVDGTGNLYFSDALTESIRKITPGGILSTIGGVFGASPGYSGDGGPALSAHLNNPWNLVVDSKGNIFFVDNGNDIIRRIDAITNTITTVAGTPTQQGYSGDGGLAKDATLTAPYGLGIDAADNLYIADSGNYVIRKVEAATGIITTVAGNFLLNGLYNGDGMAATAAGINYPNIAVVDAAGDLLIEDRNQLVRKVSPNGLVDFGDQKVGTTGSSQSVTVSNIGNTPLHFDSTTPYSVDGDFAFVSGGTCDFTQPLAEGASCTVDVTFTPTAQYERYGTLNFNDDGIGSPQVTELRGNGTSPAAPVVVLSPNPLAFPNQTVNTTSASQSITLSNTGTAVLNIEGIGIGGTNAGNFAKSSNCGTTLAAGTNCNIAVTFTPSSVANFTATLSVTDDAGGSPQAVTLSGSGVAAGAPKAVLAPSTLTFPSQTVGTTSTALTLTLSNPGNATLNISGISLSGANAASFSVTKASGDCAQSLSAGGSCPIHITFTPSSVADFTATLSVADDASGSPQTSTLSGSGIVAAAPQAVLTPSTLAFLSQTVATTSTALTLTLSNPGNATLNISGISLSGANAASFSVTKASGDCAQSLSAGSTCPIHVTFTPSSTGASTAILTVADDAASSPQTASLTGTGAAAPVAPDFSVSATPSTAEVKQGASVQYAIAIASLIASNPFDSSVALSASGLPAGATAAFSPASVTPGSNGASSTLTVATSTVSAALDPKPPSSGFTSKAGLVSAAFLFFGCWGLRKRRRAIRFVAILLMLTAGGLSTTLMSGCGGGFALPTQSTAKTYTITVTGTAGSVQHSTTVTLTVN